MNILRPMGSLILLGLLLHLPSTIFAQCPPGSILLSNQAEVDLYVATYPSCTLISGDLTIGDNTAPYTPSDIHDLSGLSNLTEIDGNLILRANPALSTLSGLGGITDIALNLDIIDNDALTDFGGLTSLQTVMQYVNILENDGLTNISTLNDLDVNFIITIKANNALTSISGLNNLDANRAVVIIENDNLTNITGLNNIHAGLTFALIDNPMLSNVTGFSYGSIITAVQVEGNTALSICNVSGICDAIFANLANIIDDNNTGCNSENEVESACLTGLPVELVDFKAKLEGRHIELSWKTLSEEKNLGFQIEYSVNGLSWTNLNFIEGFGDSYVTRTYSFLHDKPLSEKNFYRLRQMDLNGQSVLSDVREVRLSFGNKNQLAQVFPNPTAGPITIMMDNKSVSNAELTLFDSRGQIFWNEKLQAESSPEIYINHLDLPPNQLYFLQIQQGADSQMIKINTIDTF